MSPQHGHVTVPVRMEDLAELLLTANRGTPAWHRTVAQMTEAGYRTAQTGECGDPKCKLCPAPDMAYAGLSTEPIGE
jgi:hypothetical protein